MARISRGERRERSGRRGCGEGWIPAGIVSGVGRNGVDNRGGRDRVLKSEIGTGHKRV